MKTPAHYKAPLKSRAAITAWLLDRVASNRRPSYGLFCYEVKLGRLDLSFDNLARIARESGELAADASPRYLEVCREVCEARQEALYEWAVESAREAVTEDDSNRMLWDGERAVAEWEFEGRSGGWLVLTEFMGQNVKQPCDYLSQKDGAEQMLADASYDWLRSLYRFLAQCDHDFRHPEKEVEYQAAFTLFANLCADIETDEQERERLAREQAEEAERAHWEARDMVTV